MLKKLSVIVIVIVIVLSLPLSASALTMGEISGTGPVSTPKKVVVVIDQVTGEVLYSHNGDAQHIPASLTKLVTALVVLDTNPNWAKVCLVNTTDEVGGARLAANANAKYKLQDLFNASLVASANNATETLARCTGLSRPEFIARMNAKAQQFGALNTKFVDPAGMDVANITTGKDIAKLANAAFSTKLIRDTLQKKTLSFSTAGSTPKKTHSFKTTNALLGDREVLMLAGKTGYLDESLYNLAGSFKNSDGKFIITIVLGSPTKTESFSETKTIVKTTQNPFAWQAFIANNPSPKVAVTN